MLGDLKKFLAEKRWGFTAIVLGVLWGFISAFICVAGHLVIFGFNIMYIVSPLIAGFVETFIARRKYGKSTGAISALLTFILINIYGWFLPGWYYPKEPVTLSLITIIAIVLTIQAAFPTLMNYILFVTGVNLLKKVVELTVYIPSKVQRKPPEATVKEEIKKSSEETFLDEDGNPLLSIPHAEEGKIKKHVGLVIGEAIAQEKESQGLFLKLSSIVEPKQLEDLNLGEAKKLAVSRMLENAKTMGADTVVEVLIDYSSMGGFQGNALIVTATGTAVLYE